MPVGQASSAGVASFGTVAIGADVEAIGVAVEAIGGGFGGGVDVAFQATTPSTPTTVSPSAPKTSGDRALPAPSPVVSDEEANSIGVDVGALPVDDALAARIGDDETTPTPSSDASVAASAALDELREDTGNLVDDPGSNPRNELLTSSP